MKPERAYKRFVDDRDRALEKIFTFYRLKINDEIRGCYGKIAFAFIHGSIPMDSDLYSCSVQCGHLAHLMRQAMYKIAGASEIEILSRLFATRMNWRPQTDNLNESKYAEKLLYALRKLVRKLQTFAERAALEDRKLSREEIMSCFPRAKEIKKATILKKVREAQSPDEDSIDMSTSYINDDEWDDLLYGYKNTYDIMNRGPDDVLGYRNVKGSRELVYDWEMERDLTNDFVMATRAGQTDAAKANGIKEFVWIAVIDNRTCDCTGCCLPRDGLTSSEIERLLKTKWKNSEYRMSVPPAHFNCRCTIAPVTKDLPDVPKSRIGDFQDWLES